MRALQRLVSAQQRLVLTLLLSQRAAQRGNLGAALLERSAARLECGRALSGRRLCSRRVRTRCRQSLVRRGQLCLSNTEKPHSGCCRLYPNCHDWLTTAASLPRGMQTSMTKQSPELREPGGK